MMIYRPNIDRKNSQCAENINMKIYSVTQKKTTDRLKDFGNVTHATSPLLNF